jgi:hypothetical protein
MASLNSEVTLLNIWKGGFFMIDLTWKLFSQTGNIETYLLYKELSSEAKKESTVLSDRKNDSPVESN